MLILFENKNNKNLPFLFPASNYRQQNATDLHKSDNLSAKFSARNNFETTFVSTLPETLNNIITSPFRNSRTSIHGKGIIKLAELLKENIHIKSQTEALLQPVFKSIFSAAADSGNDNETLFASFYEKAHEPELFKELKTLFNVLGSDQLLVRPFIGVFLHQLMGDLIEQRASMYSRTVEKTDSAISDYDQTVLFYVSGYIISALYKQARQAGKLNSEKQELLAESLGHFLKNESDSEKTFVAKYTAWTEKVDRGGLKVPCDDFFLFIRECEMCCREVISSQHLNSGSFNTITLKEQIMDRYMVKYYIDKLAKGKLASYVIEKCISLFLTVRGHAAAKKKRQELLADIEKKAVRKVLKEKSDNAQTKK